jgi:hypothetical protein
MNYNRIGLFAVAFEFGSLSVIERYAFRGLENSLKEIYLKNNVLTEVNFKRNPFEK